MIFKKIVQTTSIVTMGTLLLSACGSSSDDKDKNSDKEDQTTTLTGVFIDSEVANIAYKTATIDGFTTSKGEFQYLDGESVVFSVGDIELPSVKAQSVITPLDITKASDIDDTQTANIARFLQSLDSDLDTDGIQIDAKAHEKAKELIIENVDFNDTSGFESAVSQLIADSGSSIKELVSKSAAIKHVQDTLDSFSKAKNRFFESELVGKTYYNTYFDEDQGNKWVLQKIEFNENNQGTFTTGDSVTASTYSVINGLLKFAYNGRVDFAKIQTFNSSLDAYEICWLERIDENIVCSGNSIDYLFSDEQKAKSYINNKNQGTTNNTEFTAEMVLGKTFYNVYSDSDAGGKWVVETIVITDGNSYTISQGNLSRTDTYAIVDGTIRLDEEGDDASFIKIQSFDDTLDAYKTCWLGSATENADCTNEGIEYLFSDEQKAQSYSDKLNGASGSDVTNTFTTENVVDQTYYMVYNEKDDGGSDEWKTETISFDADSNYTYDEKIEDKEIESGNYKIENGYIVLDVGEGVSEFISIKSYDKDLSAYSVCWNKDKLDKCEGSLILFFLDSTKADEYIKSQKEPLTTLNINLVGKTASSVITKTGCDTTNSWDYSFTDTQITQTGNDIWDDECKTGKDRTININASSIQEGDDYAFSCKNYPVCTEDDFNKVLTYKDGGRSIVSTITLSQVDGIVITYNSVTTENNIATVTNEVITIQ